MTGQGGEFGGYLGLDLVGGKPYHGDSIALNSARNALAYLIEARGIRRIWLPDYICDSVTSICVRAEIDQRFYEIGEDLRPRRLPRLDEDEWLYIVNYFGMLHASEVRDLPGVFDRIIVDNSQAFFSEPMPGVDTLYTCRKFFGVADGAYLYTGAELTRELPTGSSAEWMGHVLGRVEVDGSAFYGAYRANEARISDEPLSRMSTVTSALLGRIDYAEVARRRWENYCVLHRRLAHLNRLSVRPRSAPFAYPLYIDGGRDVRLRLHSRRVYVPTLWPNVMSDHSEESSAHRLAADLLPLPIDQRYNSADMHALADMLIDGLRA